MEASRTTITTTTTTTNTTTTTSTSLLSSNVEIGDNCKRVFSSLNVVTNEQELRNVEHNLAHYGVNSTKQVTSNEINSII